MIDLLPSTTSLPAVAPPLDSAERETRRLPLDTQGALVPLASAAQLSLRALHPLLPLLPLLGKALPPHRMERREADFLALPTPSDPLLSQEGYAVPGRSFTSAEFADPWVRIPLCTLNIANSLPPPLTATSLTLLRPLSTSTCHPSLHALHSHLARLPPSAILHAFLSHISLHPSAPSPQPAEQGFTDWEASGRRADDLLSAFSVRQLLVVVEHRIVDSFLENKLASILFILLLFALGYVMVRRCCIRRARRKRAAELEREEQELISSTRTILPSLPAALNMELIERVRSRDSPPPLLSLPFTPTLHTNPTPSPGPSPSHNVHHSRGAYEGASASCRLTPR